MPQFFLYPHTDLNQQNFDWIIKTIKDLQEQIISAGAGIQVITLASEMTDQNVIYIYRGSEVGYTYDHWYYYDVGTAAWVDGGAFGFDTSLLPLSIANGGTGSGTDAAGARSSLGITPANIGAVAVSDLPLSVTNGGTGASNAADARTALQITPANIGAMLDVLASADLGDTFDNDVANGQFRVVSYSAGATDAPTSAAGIALVFRVSGSNGAMIAYDNANAYVRGLNGLTWSAWAVLNQTITSPARYVKASGKTGDWDWIQWDDDTVDMWASASATTSCDGTWGSIYTTPSGVKPSNYPFTFASAPVTECFLEGGGASLAGFYISINGTTTVPPELKGWRPTTAATVTLLGKWYVHGKITT